jgi:transcriptional antiterminator RfaH
MVAMSKIENGSVEVKRRWSVVVSKPNAERLAKHHLENQGFEVYLPLIISERPKGRRIPPGVPHGGLIVRPFFPSILFVRIDPMVDRWRAIWSTQGVKAMYLVAERPAFVKDGQVERIMAQEENGFIKMGEPDAASGFKAGDPVKVRGQHVDMEATFLEPVDKDRVAVLLKLFQREQRTVVTLISLK